MSRLQWDERVPQLEGRYLWRLGPTSALYQVCLLVRADKFTPDDAVSPDDLVAVACTAQLWLSKKGMQAQITFDRQPAKEVGGEWLLLSKGASPSDQLFKG